MRHQRARFAAPGHSNAFKYHSEPSLSMAVPPAFGVVLRHLSASRGCPGLPSSIPLGAITHRGCPASVVPRGASCAGKSSVFSALHSSLGRILRPAAPRYPESICAGGSDGIFASSIGKGGPCSSASPWPAAAKWGALTHVPWGTFYEGLRQAVKRPDEATETPTRASADSTTLVQKVSALKFLPAGLGRSTGLWLRICTGVPLALAAIGAVLLSPLPAFAALGWVQSLVGLGEFLALCEKKKFAVASLAGNATANALVMGAAATGNSETHLLVGRWSFGVSMQNGVL